jgi:5-formyltetrahydrofolate cyclo-ligase
VIAPADKAPWRRRMRDVRRSISDRPSRSIACCAAVAALPAFRRAPAVLSYVAIASEVDTASLHERVRADGKLLILPRVEGDELVAVEAAPGTAFVRSPLGIDEPTGAPLAVGDLAATLVVVPGLAFTSDGHRLGYGGGYFDRLLARLPGSATTVGVCFREQLVDDLPLDPHDRPVDLVISA